MKEYNIVGRPRGSFPTPSVRVGCKGARGGGGGSPNSDFAENMHKGV